jgi:aminoglycoside phosphotransferase (APT) family kinase protein
MATKNIHATKVETDKALVRQLIATQFPQWADLPITPVALGGWDNRTFHLGSEMSVRLPSAADYLLQVEKEQRWLPKLAPHLPFPIPTPVALGAPTHDYPWPWSVYRWLPGETVSLPRIADLTQFATTLAHFLRALQRIDATDGPPPGPHCFYRGAPPAVYDDETRRALAMLSGQIDTDLATKVWESALTATWSGTPVWFHGDVAVGNLLLNDGRLSAVIDFGACGVGDPACDTVIAWTLLSGVSRQLFRTTLGVDHATWARGRGWALWKALITLVEHIDTDAVKANEARRVIAEVLADHRCAGRHGV